jgi:cyclopropane-fatty-acyl-phospholipid synthase
MSRTVNERLILGMLSRLSFGTLKLTLPNGEIRQYGTSQPLAGESPVNSQLAPALSADLHIHDASVFGDILRGGDIAFAQCYLSGRVTSTDLPSLLKLLVRNRQTVEQALHGSWWGVLLDRLRHLLRANTKRQAKKNIEAHYDLGNDFYKLWLDPSMTYSSAIFEAPFVSIQLDAEHLQAAQTAKYQRVLTQLGGTKNAQNAQNVQHFLEIGCGWGGLAEVATAHNDKKLTGLTLSTEQLVYATERLAALDRLGSVNLKLQDYREEGAPAQPQDKRYDGIASIEMFEAVGESYWPSYFECLARNLKLNGRACVQSIVIKNELFARYRTGTDFIQRYIFPGGMLPSPEIFVRYAADVGLRLVDQFAFGKDYARTLAVWRMQFLAALPAVREQGYDERFIRMWEFYLAYCEAGFDSGDTDVIQFTLEWV